MPLKSEPDLMSHWEFCYERSLGCKAKQSWLSLKARESDCAVCWPWTMRNQQAIEAPQLPTSNLQPLPSEDGRPSLSENEIQSAIRSAA